MKKEKKKTSANEIIEICGYSGCVTLRIYKRKYKIKSPYELHRNNIIIARFDTEEKARMSMDMYAVGASSMYGVLKKENQAHQKRNKELEETIKNMKKRCTCTRST